MDYASEIDSQGNPARQKQRGGWSFLVIAIGTICLIAAWILTASDPYSELANRVVEVNTPSEDADHGPADQTVGPPDGAMAAQGPIGLLPDRAAGEDAAFREMIESLPAATTRGTHPAEIERAATPPRSGLPELARRLGPHPQSDSGSITVPVEEFAGPPAPDEETGEIELTLAQRRAVQRRLNMAGHDAGPPDGVFGPMTQEAVAAFQEAAGLTVTGDLDDATLGELKERTDAAYAAWAESHRTTSASRRVQGGTETAQTTAPYVPSHGDGCARAADGSILPNQGFGCDLRGLVGSGAPGRQPFQPGVDR